MSRSKSADRLYGPGPVQELVDHLQRLIRIDTSNPPGRETEAAQYIADVFKQEDIRSRSSKRSRVEAMSWPVSRVTVPWPRCC